MPLPLSQDWGADHGAKFLIPNSSFLIYFAGRIMARRSSSQVLLVFFLPLVTAGIHVAAAFPMLCKLLELFNLFDVRLFALCAAGTLLVFCAIYALVYGLTTRTYSRIVGIRS